jgi:hypothetical protein
VLGCRSVYFDQDANPPVMKISFQFNDGPPTVPQLPQVFNCLVTSDVLHAEQVLLRRGVSTLRHSTVDLPTGSLRAIPSPDSVARTRAL